MKNESQPCNILYVKTVFMNSSLPPLDQPVALTMLPTLVSVLPCRVAAGFPSPAEDHAVQRVDLMAQLIKHPQATFLLRVRGESMKDAGIFDNDVVLVDRAITAR
jgi:DNA polymerase V